MLPSHGGVSAGGDAEATTLRPLRSRRRGRARGINREEEERAPVRSHREEKTPLRLRQESGDLGGGDVPHGSH